MICDHITYVENNYGARATCSKCGKPVIWNGKKWVWEFELGTSKVRSMSQQHRINALKRPS